jgi:hypothetical protein
MAAIKRDQPWRTRLTRDVGWSLIVKLGLLTLLWALFFSGSHRCRVDGPATANRLAVGGDSTQSHWQTMDGGGHRCD